MKLEKPIELNSQVELQLRKLKGKVLMNEQGQLIVIGNFKTEDLVDEWVAKFTRKPKKRIKRCLTEIDLWGWHGDLGFWGTFNEEGVKRYIDWFDFAKMRNYFEENIMKPLEKLGLKFEIPGGLNLKDLNKTVNKA